MGRIVSHLSENQCDGINFCLWIKKLGRFLQ